ncbi:hypothetical protein BTK72_21730 [Cronobacter sakazakii]|nr:hypothetical protein BTK72_21730 [Cronobacter sakazakii]
MLTPQDISIKKPAICGLFNLLKSRGSFAYPFLSLLRLVAVRVKWLTCCFKTSVLPLSMYIWWSWLKATPNTNCLIL